MPVVDFNGQAVSFPDDMSPEELKEKVRLVAIKLKLEKPGVGEALWSGTKRSAAGMGKFMGILDEQEYADIYNREKPIQEARPILSGIGEFGPVIGSALLTGGAAGLAAGGARLIGAAGAAFGGGAADTMSQHSRLIQEGVDPATAEKSAGTSGLITGAGILLPGGVGGGLAKKTASGVAMNVPLGMGERAIQNEILSEYPEQRRDILDPTAMALDAAFGAFGGATAHVASRAGQKKSPQEDGTPTPPGFKDEPTPEVTKEAIEQKLQGHPRDIRTDIFDSHVKAFQEEETIKSLEAKKERLSMDIHMTENPAKRAELEQKLAKTDEQLTRSRTKLDDFNRRIAINEVSYRENATRFGVKQRSAIEEATEWLETAKKVGDTEAIRRAEIVIGREKERLAREGIQQEVSPAKEAPIKQEELPVTTEALDTAQQSVKQDNLKIQDARQEYKNNLNEIDSLTKRLEQEGPSLVERDPSLYDGIKSRIQELESRNTSLAKRYAKDNDVPLDDSIPADRQPSPGLKVKNATAEEAQLVQDIIEKFGLQKDDIEIDLAADSSGVRYTDTGYDVSIAKDQTKQPTLITEKAKRFWRKLNGEDAARFEKAWTIAHEIGHIALNKLLRNNIYDGQVAKLHADFAAWVVRNPTQAKHTGNILPSRDAVANIRDPEYYQRFPEYFAQRVAREMSKTSDTPIGKFVSDIKGIWKEVTAHFSMGTRSMPVIDDFIQSIIRQNREALQQTGKTIWEITSVEESRTPRQAFEIQSRDYDVTIRSDYDLAMPSQREVISRVFPDNIGDVISTVEDVVAKQQHYQDSKPVSSGLVRDVVGMVVGKLGASYGNAVVPLLQKAGLSNSPAIKWAVNVIANANQKTYQRQNRILGGEAQSVKRRGMWTNLQRLSDPKSYAALAEKAKNEDFYAVLKVFQEGQGRYDYGPNLELHGQHLTPFQRELYNATARVLKETLEEQNKFLVGMGKKTRIIEKLGYLPTTRQGKYAVVLEGGADYTRGFNDDGSAIHSNVLHMERFFTELEAKAWIEEFNKANPNAEVKPKIVEKEEVQANNFQAEILFELKQALEEAGASEAMLGRVQEKIEALIGKGGTIGSHHKHQMGFITGFKGTELLYSQADQARSFRDGIFGYVREVTKQIEKQEISTNLDLLLNNEVIRKNANLHEVLTDMREYATITEEGPKTKMFKESIDMLWTGIHRAFGDKSYHPEHHVYDGAMGKVTHAFYIKALMSRPAFWVAQATAFTVGFRSLVYNQGLIGATMDIGTGMKQLFNNDKEFFDFVDWVRDNRTTFHPQFINDLNKFGLFDKTSERFQKLIGYLTGETPATATDSFSRLVTASYLFAHYKKQGMRGKDLYETVAMKTDENMVLYGQTYKAPMYEKMGVIGDLISPLATFSHAQIANLAVDAKYLIDKKSLQASLPLITTVITSAVAGGLIGMVGAAELELLIRIVNWALRKNDIDYQLPTIFEMAMSEPTGVEVIDRTLSHGITTAATIPFSDEGGFDVGSANRWRSLIADIISGEKNFWESVPVLSWALDQPSAFKTAFNSSATPGERRAAIQQLPLPGWGLGITDAMIFDSFTANVQPNRGNDPVLKATPERAVANFLGTQTVEEHKFSNQRFRDQKKIKELRMEADKLMDRIVAGTIDDPQAAVEKLSSMYMMTPEQITQGIESRMIRQNFAYEEMITGNKNFSVPTGPELKVWMDK